MVLNTWLIHGAYICGSRYPWIEDLTSPGSGRVSGFGTNWLICPSPYHLYHCLLQFIFISLLWHILIHFQISMDFHTWWWSCFVRLTPDCSCWDLNDVTLAIEEINAKYDKNIILLMMLLMLRLAFRQASWWQFCKAFYVLL